MAFEYTPKDDLTFYLDRILFRNGYAFIHKVDGVLYALEGSLTGLLDPYMEHRDISLVNEALNLAVIVPVTDGVLVRNTNNKFPVKRLIERYCALMEETETTIRTDMVLTRLMLILSCSDDKTKQSCDTFLKNIVEGELSTIMSSAFFDGVKVHGTPVTGNLFSQLIEMSQYLKGSLLNDLGINANYNMKREALGSNEAALNDDFLLPLVGNMLIERKRGLEAVNKRFGTSYDVRLSSVWETVKLEDEKQKALAEAAKETLPDGDGTAESGEGGDDGNNA